MHRGTVLGHLPCFLTSFQKILGGFMVCLLHLKPCPSNLPSTGDVKTQTLLNKTQNFSLSIFYTPNFGYCKSGLKKLWNFIEILVSQKLLLVPDSFFIEYILGGFLCYKWEFWQYLISTANALKYETKFHATHAKNNENW